MDERRLQNHLLDYTYSYVTYCMSAVSVRDLIRQIVVSLDCSFVTDLIYETLRPKTLDT